MVGNDIVDLSDSESRSETLHPRFDSRVFSAAERRAIDASTTPNRARWLRWSAKEAVYKIERRRRGAIFSPRRFEVGIGLDSSGVVGYREARYRVRWEEREGALHAVAIPAEFSERWLLHGLARLDSGLADDPDEPGRAARRLCRSRLSQQMEVHESDLSIRRVDRIPQVWLLETQLPLWLSLSHHGAWVAFACSRTPESAPCEALH